MTTTTKRVREVHSVDMVAHLWAHQSQESARNGGRDNFFFRGDTIYSYGTHFPIARHVKGTRGRKAFLFTTGRYSVTTSGHCNVVRGAIPAGATVFYVADVEGGPAGLLAWVEEEIARLAAECGKRRKKDHALSELKGAVAKGNALAEFFGSRRRFGLPDSFDLATAERLASDHAHKEDLRRRKLEKRRAAELTQRQADALLAAQRWIAGEPVQRWEIGHAEGTFLRIKPDDPETVETSRGAEFPLAHAKRILPAVRSGVPYQHNGHTIHAGAFRIDAIDADGNVRAGCHYVTRTEIERFAATLGW